MTSSNHKPASATPDRFAKRRQQTRRLLVLMLFALLLLWLFQWRLGVFKEEQIQAKHQADSLVALAAQQAQHIQDSLQLADSLRQASLLHYSGFHSYCRFLSLTGSKKGASHWRV